MRKNDSVSHVMTKDVVKLDFNDPVSTARKLIEYSGIHHLPIDNGHRMKPVATEQLRGVAHSTR